MIKKLKILWQWMQNHRFWYGAAIGALFVSTWFSYLSPLVIRTAIDAISNDQLIEAPELILKFVEWLGGISMLKRNLWIATLAIITSAGLQGLFFYLKGRWSAQAAEATAQQLRNRVYDHLQQIPVSCHARFQTGDLVQRCTSDVETIRRFLAVQLSEIGRSLVMVILVVPIMLYLDWRMTLVATASLPIIFGFALVFFTKVRSVFQLADEAEAAMSSVLQENLSGIRVVRAFTRQDYERQKFAAKNQQHRDQCCRLITLMAYYWSISDFLCLTQIAAVVLMGSRWAAAGQFTLGTMVVFLAYEVRLLWPVRHLGMLLAELGKALVALERIDEILTQPAEPQNNTAGCQVLPSLQGEIRFDRVSFAYRPGFPVLHDVSFHIIPGQTVAIMGPTGCGKSTLVKLLLRLYDYEHGSITVDGHELKSLPRRWLRQQIAVVLQEPFLYSKTISENIGMGNGGADLDDIQRAAQMADIHNVIVGFNHGYDTEVGERGILLSGGQKQRVALARAMLRQPKILVLDDSLSAIDNETEARVHQTLKTRKGKTTTLIIAHRLTTVVQADYILVIADGKIVQAGTHEQLQASDGIYRRVWKIQHSDEENMHQRCPDTARFLAIAR